MTLRLDQRFQSKFSGTYLVGIGKHDVRQIHCWILISSEFCVVVEFGISAIQVVYTI